MNPSQQNLFFVLSITASILLFGLSLFLWQKTSARFQQIKQGLNYHENFYSSEMVAQNLYNQKQPNRSFASSFSKEEAVKFRFQVKSYNLSESHCGLVENSLRKNKFLSKVCLNSPTSNLTVRYIVLSDVNRLKEVVYDTEKKIFVTSPKNLNYVLVQPRTLQQGISGCRYVESVSDSEGRVFKLSSYGEVLDENEQVLYQDPKLISMAFQDGWWIFLDTLGSIYLGKNVSEVKRVENLVISDAISLVNGKGVLNAACI